MGSGPLATVLLHAAKLDGGDAQAEHRADGTQRPPPERAPVGASRGDGAGHAKQHSLAQAQARTGANRAGTRIVPPAGLLAGRQLSEARKPAPPDIAAFHHV